MYYLHQIILEAPQNVLGAVITELGAAQDVLVACLFDLLLFYVRATVFQLYHDGNMMHEMRRRKPELTLLPTQEIFNLPHHIGMVGEELAF